MLLTLEGNAVDPVVRVLVCAVASHDETLAKLVPLVHDLHPRLLQVEADVSTLKADVSTLKGDMSTLKGDMSTLKADVAEGNRRAERMYGVLLAIAAKVGLTDAERN